MIKRTTTAKEMAQHLRVGEISFVPYALKHDYKEMPREKVKTRTGGQWRFNINEVMDWIQKEFN